MKKDIIILGSTGSIGKSTLDIIRKKKNNFNINLLSTNTNIKTIINQCAEFKVKNVIIKDKKKYLKYKKDFKKKNIKVFFDIKDIKKILLKKKVYCTINAISGIDGLVPTLEIIKYSKNILIANKESIICAWEFISKALKKYNTNFIPIDSEHFSIWSLLKSEEKTNVDKIYLTASGGPFLKKRLNSLSEVKPSVALKHPNWNMGKKISIDSATMMNKVFEIVEAKKIFDLKLKKFKIIIHPKSYIHAIIIFKNGLIKLLAHDTNMKIPIGNAIYDNKFLYFKNDNNLDIKKLNNINLMKPDVKRFPLLKILKKVPNNFTYFETVMVTLNDELVAYYLNQQIKFLSIHKILLKLINREYFKRFYNKRPRHINDIKIMVDITKKYLQNYLKKNEYI